MGVEIIIDSCSDVSKAYVEANGLCLLPLRVNFGDKEYLDGVNLSSVEFYNLLESSKALPTTSQLTPYDYGTVLEKVMTSDNEAVIITISSKLSGTYQSAVAAAQEYGGRVFVVDSENAAIGELVLVEYAVRLRNEGRSAQEIFSELERRKKDIRLIAMLNTLEYLQKGGRISKTVSFVGGILNIKPVIEVKDGAVEYVGKARGSKQSNNYLNEFIEKYGVDFSMPYMLGYSGNDDTLLNKYIDDSRHIWQSHTDKLPVSVIGCTIGTHVGPGAIAVAFFTK